MVIFKSITLKNFLSYGNVPTVIPLDNPGTTLIMGENLDDTASGAGSNGVGKTSIINALAYAIYDKPISNISKDNLVNNINKKNMEVTVEFECKGKNYVVTRVRKSKAGALGNYVQVFENGKDITPDNVANTNDVVEKIVGIPYELFVRIVTFTATLTPFLDLPVRSHYTANQTDIIEELFDLKTLSEKANVLKDKIKETEQSLETNLARVEQLKKEYERHDKQLASAKKRIENWDEQNKREVFEIQRKLKRLENVDVDAQKGLHSRLSEIDDELEEALSKQRTVETEIRSLTKKMNEKEKDLKHLRDAQCPYCLQKYDNAAAKISESEKFVQEASTTLQELAVVLADIDSEVELLTGRHKETKAQITVADVEELSEIKSKVAHYQQKLEELQNATNPYIEPLKELEDIKLEPLDMEPINKLTRLIEHQKFLLKLLTKKDSFVRKALLNKNIPFLNQKLSKYLTDLGLRHTVEFTHEMTAQISEFGRPLDFGNLSTGQRARVNLALSFAFRDVLQSIHGKINVCMLDEVLDVGLDAVGVQAAARMLKRKARDEGLSLFVISHRDEIDSAFDRKLIIQMSKGFSYVKMEEE